MRRFGSGFLDVNPNKWQRQDWEGYGRPGTLDISYNAERMPDAEHATLKAPVEGDPAEPSPYSSKQAPSSGMKGDGPLKAYEATDTPLPAWLSATLNPEGQQQDTLSRAVSSLPGGKLVMPDETELRAAEEDWSKTADNSAKWYNMVAAAMVPQWGQVLAFRQALKDNKLRQARERYNQALSLAVQSRNAEYGEKVRTQDRGWKLEDDEKKSAEERLKDWMAGNKQDSLLSGQREVYSTKLFFVPGKGYAYHSYTNPPPANAIPLDLAKVQAQGQARVDAAEVRANDRPDNEPNDIRQARAALYEKLRGLTSASYRKDWEERLMKSRLEASPPRPEPSQKEMDESWRAHEADVTARIKEELRELDELARRGGYKTAPPPLSARPSVAPASGGVIDFSALPESSDDQY